MQNLRYAYYTPCIYRAGGVVNHISLAQPIAPNRALNTIMRQQKQWENAQLQNNSVLYKFANNLPPVSMEFRKKYELPAINMPSKPPGNSDISIGPELSSQIATQRPLSVFVSSSKFKYSKAYQSAGANAWLENWLKENGGMLSKQ
jgi:hypothetical protein